MFSLEQRVHFIEKTFEGIPKIEITSYQGLTVDFCKKNNILFNIDNCFATPYLQNPAKYGADLIVHSATKWMDGQGRVLGGIVVGNPELIEKEIRWN